MTDKITTVMTCLAIRYPRQPTRVTVFTLRCGVASIPTVINVVGIRGFVLFTPRPGRNRCDIEVDQTCNVLTTEGNYLATNFSTQICRLQLDGPIHRIYT